MSDVRVIIQRDSEREERVVTTGTTAADLFAGDRSIVAARVGGQLKDLAYEPADGEEIEPVEITSQDGLDILRHSTAHVMAQAVQELFPEAKLGIGPPIKDGFYYDFDVETPFTPEDLKALEKRMQEIVKAGQYFSRREISDADAAAEDGALGLYDFADADDGTDGDDAGDTTDSEYQDDLHDFEDVCETADLRAGTRIREVSVIGDGFDEIELMVAR